MDTILTIFFFIIIIGFLVFVHELGHFMAAKFSGVFVKEFAIGFGTTIYQRKIGETNYKLNLLPIGGYVNLEGEEESQNPNGFRNKPFFIKALILSAGVIMNFLTATVFLAIFLATSNNSYIIPSIVNYNFNNVSAQKSLFPVAIFEPDSQWGWKNIDDGELITGFEGTYFENYRDFIDLVESKNGSTVEATFLDLATYSEYTKQVTIGGKVTGEGVAVKIVELQEDSPAKDLLSVGSLVVSINDRKFERSQDFFDILKEVQGSEAEFGLIVPDSGQSLYVDINLPVADESGAILKAQVIPVYGAEVIPLQPSYGVYLIKYYSNIFAPLSFTADLSIYQINVLSQLVADAFSTGDFQQVSEAFGGPIAVGNIVGQIVQLNRFETLIPITALISLSLAIFNILPFPALDGGQIVIAAIESIRRKKLPDHIVNRVNYLGFAFLMFVFALVMFKDILQFNVIESISQLFNNILGR